MANRFMKYDQNLLSRVRNLFAEAIQKNVLLPKLLVIVLDDDLIKFLSTKKINITTDSVGDTVNKLMKQLERLVKSQKEFLQKRSKKINYPQIVWIQAPTHTNFRNNSEREILNESMIHMAKLQEFTTILELKKIWDPEDSNLFLYESERFTAVGYSTYWKAIDCTIRYADTILFKKLDSKKKKHSTKPLFKRHAEHYNQQVFNKKPSKYYWENKSKSYRNSKQNCGRILPTPPGRRDQKIEE